MRSRYLTGLGGSIASILILTLGFCCWEAREPNETLVFTREIRATTDPETVARKLDHVSEWRKWFYSVSKVEIDGSEKAPPRAGARVRIYVDPKRGPWGRFEITADLVEYVPSHRITLRIIGDTKGKLTRLFDELIWTVELVPDGKGLLIRGTETAHTIHWRSRLFGRIAQRILMHQIFYPNLMELAHPKQQNDSD